MSLAPGFLYIGTVLGTDPECIINIYVILGRRNLFEMGAVRSVRESQSVALFGGSEFWKRAPGFVYMGNNNSVKRIAAALGGVYVFLGFLCASYRKMGIVAKCPISLKMTPLKGGGVLVPVSQSKLVELAWPLALNISFCLRTLRL